MSPHADQRSVSISLLDLTLRPCASFTIFEQAQFSQDGECDKLPFTDESLHDFRAWLIVGIEEARRPGVHIRLSVIVRFGGCCVCWRQGRMLSSSLCPRVLARVTRQLRLLYPTAAPSPIDQP
jgi:hypothetical protein